MEGVERWLNIFPSTNRHDLDWSPAMVVEGRDYPDGTVKRIAFGTCAMVYTGTKNDLSTRTEPCVALRDSNDSGGHYFMLLKTGRRAHANKWTEVPTSQEIIDRIHRLAEGTKQQWRDMESLIFESGPGMPIMDNTPIFNDASHHEEVIKIGTLKSTTECLQQPKTLMTLSLQEMHQEKNQQ